MTSVALRTDRALGHCAALLGEQAGETSKPIEREGTQSCRTFGRPLAECVYLWFGTCILSRRDSRDSRSKGGLAGQPSFRKW
jgi:hypothetical protein